MKPVRHFALFLVVLQTLGENLKPERIQAHLWLIDTETGEMFYLGSVSESALPSFRRAFGMRRLPLSDGSGGENPGFEIFGAEVTAGSSSEEPGDVN